MVIALEELLRTQAQQLSDATYVVQGFGNAKAGTSEALEFNGETFDTTGLTIPGGRGGTLHDAIRRSDGRKAILSVKSAGVSWVDLLMTSG